VNRLARAAWILAFAATAAGAQATKMDAASGDLAFEARLKRLEGELRCLVCQNQTLADSNADLAADLRREVRDLARSGKSDDEIKSYLVARYGDFVLYNPPVKATTWLLWGGPFALLVGGGLMWSTIMRRRAHGGAVPAPAADREAQARARARLEQDDDPR
jgi:cytochrome c-type biogenesis protein CcmH